MPKFKVSVEKQMYATGVVDIEAETPDAAWKLVEYRIAAGEIQTTAVEWDDPEYIDFSFGTTRDVDEIEEDNDES